MALISCIKDLSIIDIKEKLFGNMPNEIIIKILKFLSYRDLIYLELILPNINHYTSIILENNEINYQYKDINILVDITRYNNLSLFKRVFMDFEIYFSYGMCNLKEVDPVLSPICNTICTLNNAEFFEYLVEKTYDDTFDDTTFYYIIILYCVLRNNKYKWLNKILDKICSMFHFINLDKFIKYIYDKNDNVEILKEYLEYNEIKYNYSYDLLVLYAMDILEDLDKFSSKNKVSRPKCRDFLIEYIDENSLYGMKND